jgi:hypothetical protein
MSRDQWRDLLEAIGFLVLIASLIFVGLQIRQDHTIAQAQNAADFDDTMIEYARVINANRDVWIRGLEGAELSLQDQVTFESVAFAVWQKFTGLYRRDRLLNQGSGILAARQLAGELFIHPGLRQYVLSRCRHRESVGQEISLCDDVRSQLKAFDDGTLPAPEGKLYVL